MSEWVFIWSDNLAEVHSLGFGNMLCCRTSLGSLAKYSNGLRWLVWLGTATDLVDWRRLSVWIGLATDFVDRLCCLVPFNLGYPLLFPVIRVHLGWLGFPYMGPGVPQVAFLKDQSTQGTQYDSSWYFILAYMSHNQWGLCGTSCNIFICQSHDSLWTAIGCNYGWDVDGLGSLFCIICAARILMLGFFHWASKTWWLFDAFSKSVSDGAIFSALESFFRWFKGKWLRVLLQKLKDWTVAMCMSICLLWKNQLFLP